MSSPWKYSAGKASIVPKIQGMSMLGYGQPDNIVRGVHTDINARVMIIRSNSSSSKLLIINLEICFISDSIRQNVLEEINKIEKFEESEVIISSQHTHSAPSGFTHYAMYNMPTPGFSKEVLESFVGGVLKAFNIAKENEVECDIEFKKSTFSSEIPVSFNRSIEAYMENPEVKLEGLSTKIETALDKTMRVINFVNEGKSIGAINWFAVHTTSIPNTNTLISPDNKGHASVAVESRYGENYVSIFAQGDAGDVTPNWVYDQKTKTMRGHFEDHHENAKFNGQLQATKLQEIIEQEEKFKIENELDSVLVYKDFSNIVPDKEFMPAGASSYAATTNACHGVAFAEGTREGLGVNGALAFVLKVLATFVKVIDLIKSVSMNEKAKKEIWHYYSNQEPKSIFAEAGKKRILGISKLDRLGFLGIVDPLVGTMANFYKNGSMRENTWTQEVLPVQLIKLGKILIVSVPAETTTIAGRRIREQLKTQFSDAGVEIEEVISAPYSNAYCGYIVTPQEYKVQCYEAGHCVFGKWTLPAFQTVLKELAVELLKDKQSRNISDVTPPKFSQQELSARSFK